jgi:hypothetical protein
MCSEKNVMPHDKCSMLRKSGNLFSSQTPTRMRLFLVPKHLWPPPWHGHSSHRVKLLTEKYQVYGNKSACNLLRLSMQIHISHCILFSIKTIWSSIQRDSSGSLAKLKLYLNIWLRPSLPVWASTEMFNVAKPRAVTTYRVLINQRVLSGSMYYAL